MPSSRDSQLARINPEEVLREEPTGLAPAPITRHPEEKIYVGTFDVGVDLTLQVSLARKEMWEVTTNASFEEPSMQSENFIRVPSLSTKEQPVKEWDTRISPFFSFAFLTDAGSTWKSNSFVKAVGTFVFFIFGSVDTLVQRYLWMAGVTLVFGVSADIVHRRASFQRVQKLVFNQIGMLAGIALFNLGLAALFGEGYLGSKAQDVRPGIICWFFFCNFLASLKYLEQLGVPFPPGTRKWIKAIRTVLDGP